jgi:hypothetical protein
MDDETRTVDLEVFTVHLEGFAIGADTDALPFAPGTQIVLVLGDAIDALRSHHCGIWAGSVRAWNTRSGGAAMKISARTVLLSGVIWVVAIGEALSAIGERSIRVRTASLDIFSS